MGDSTHYQYTQEELKEMLDELDERSSNLSERELRKLYDRGDLSNREVERLEMRYSLRIRN